MDIKDRIIKETTNTTVVYYLDITNEFKQIFNDVDNIISEAKIRLREILKRLHNKQELAKEEKCVVKLAEYKLEYIDKTIKVNGITIDSGASLYITFKNGTTIEFWASHFGEVRRYEQEGKSDFVG